LVHLLESVQDQPHPHDSFRAAVGPFLARPAGIRLPADRWDKKNRTPFAIEVRPDAAVLTPLRLYRQSAEAD
jgi:hypothetical protein